MSAVFHELSACDLNVKDDKKNTAATSAKMFLYLNIYTEYYGIKSLLWTLLSAHLDSV